MGRSTDFCAESGQFRLQVKIPQNTSQNTGGLTLLFVIHYAAAIAALSATPVASYDRDFRKFTDVTCLKPKEILKAP